MNRLLLTLFALTLFVCNAQAQWTPKGVGVLPANYFLFQIEQVNDTLLWGIANDRTLWSTGSVSPTKQPFVVRSIDGGENWSGVYVTPAAGYVALDMMALNHQEFYFTSYNGSTSYRMFYTADAGATWSEKTNAQMAGSIGVIIKAFSPTDLLSLGWAERVAISDDAGQTWASGTTPPAIGNEFFGRRVGNNNTAVVGDKAWLGTTKGRIYYTTDKGLTWAAVNTSLYPDFLISNVAFEDDQHGLASSIMDSNGDLSGAMLVGTTDGGITWSFVGSPPARLLNISAVPGLPGTYVGVSSSLGGSLDNTYITFNRGQSWQALGNSSGHKFASITFSSPTLGWASFGGSATSTSPLAYKWTGTVSALSTGIELENGPKVYPNPVYGGKSQLSFKVNDHTKAMVSVADALGRRIFFKEIACTPGQNLTELNLINASPGIYTVSVQHNQFVQHTLMVLQ